MICDGQEYIEITWNPKNIHYYMDKGYEYTGYNKKFKVKFEDLMPTSGAKIHVKCDYCGKEFDITYAHYHRKPEDDKSIACQGCTGKKLALKSLHKRQEESYEIINDFCDKYGYKLITQKDEIINNQSLIRYECPIHGIVETRVTSIKQNKICYGCSRKNALRNKSKTTLKDRQEKHYARALEIANDKGYKLLSSKTDITKNTDYIRYECPIHGEHSMRVANFLWGKGCPECAHIESKGEKAVKKMLKKSDVEFIQEKSFTDCRDKHALPFDFYLPDLNTCIEYDGEQHYFNIKYFGNSLESVQEHDRIKTKYCEDNGIKLIRIPYWEYDNIESILTTELNIHKDIV